MIVSRQQNIQWSLQAKVFSLFHSFDIFYHVPGGYQRNDIVESSYSLFSQVRDLYTLLMTSPSMFYIDKPLIVPLSKRSDIIYNRLCTYINLQFTLFNANGLPQLHG